MTSVVLLVGPFACTPEETATAEANSTGLADEGNMPNDNDGTTATGHWVGACEWPSFMVSTTYNGHTYQNPFDIEIALDFNLVDSGTGAVHGAGSLGVGYGVYPMEIVGTRVGDEVTAEFDTDSGGDYSYVATLSGDTMVGVFGFAGDDTSYGYGPEPIECVVFR